MTVSTVRPNVDNLITICPACREEPLDLLRVTIDVETPIIDYKCPHCERVFSIRYTRLTAWIDSIIDYPRPY